jgi:NAD+ diphosphatase
MRVLTYTDCRLDRAGHLRQDEAWLAARRRDPDSVVLLLRDLQVAVDGDGRGPRLGLVPVGELDGPLPEHAMFLGLDGERAVFAASVAEAPPGLAFVELRGVGSLLPAPEAGLAAYARGLAFWQGRQGFCNACGARTDPVAGGHARRCVACGAEHFPRTDPAVIVLVHHGDHCLLGRSARFPEGMYSTLAGFVEPGESLEDAVVREVFEESGVRALRPRYLASQPWPFPASLMLGFHAEAEARVLRVDRTELVDARWIARADLLDPERRPVRLPSPDSIARHLIETWLQG